jgi:CRP/FNR family transcriptional regulator, anaerobic regulatory protein
MIEHLIRVFDAIEPLNAEERALFDRVFTPREVRKGAHLLEADAHCDEIGFVVEGIFRTYFYNRNGQEITKYFSLPGQFVCDFPSFEEHMRTSEYIQAETACTILVCDRAGFNTIRAGVRRWENYLFRMYQHKHILRSREREERIGLSPTEVYERFVEQHGMIAQQVPVGHIASYLGITPQSLSRIRRRITVGIS